MPVSGADAHAILEATCADIEDGRAVLRSHVQDALLDARLACRHPGVRAAIDMELAHLPGHSAMSSTDALDVLSWVQSVIRLAETDGYWWSGEW